MEEGKKILGVFLVVLFVIIVLGVIISRARSQTKSKPLIGGSLESILFPDRPTPKPTTIVAEKAKTSGTTSTEGSNTTSKTDTQAGHTGSTEKTNKTGDVTTSTTTTNSSTTGSTTSGQGSQGQTNQGQTQPRQSDQSPVVLGQSTTTTNGGTTTTSGSNGTGTTSTTAGSTTGSDNASKGSVSNAQNIPDTGTPTIFLSFALSALGSGIALRKFSGISLKKMS